MRVLGRLHMKQDAWSNVPLIDDNLPALRCSERACKRPETKQRLTAVTNWPAADEEECQTLVQRLKGYVRNMGRGFSTEKSKEKAVYAEEPTLARSTPGHDTETPQTPLQTSNWVLPELYRPQKLIRVEHEAIPPSDDTGADTNMKRSGN